MAVKYWKFLDAGAAGGDPGNTDPPKSPDPKGDPQGDPKAAPGPVPYDRFNEVNGELKAARTELEQLKAAEQKRQEEDLKKREEWKTLAEQREEALKAKELEIARLRVAHNKGLPPELVDRLKGGNEDELAADADSLIALLGEQAKPKGSAIPLIKSSGQPNNYDIAKMTPAEIRKARAEGKLSVK